jgi:hypothetical protein
MTEIKTDGFKLHELSEHCGGLRLTVVVSGKDRTAVRRSLRNVDAAKADLLSVGLTDPLFLLHKAAFISATGCLVDPVGFFNDEGDEIPGEVVGALPGVLMLNEDTLSWIRKPGEQPSK